MEAQEMQGINRTMEVENDLYRVLTDKYREVQKEFNIPEKSKKQEKNESTVGFFILVAVAVVVALVITTPFPWYLGLIGVARHCHCFRQAITHLRQGKRKRGLCNRHSRKPQ